jgi:hypothetical protein
MIAAALTAALACPAQPALVAERRPNEVRTAVVACDGDRRVVARRARLQRRPLSGRRITAVSGAGRRVAWGELRHAGGTVQAEVRVSRIARGRATPVHRRVVLPRGSMRRPAVLIRGRPFLDVALTSHGELAWLTDWRVHVARLRGPARVVARDGDFGLGLEDDRTLRWWTDDEPRVRFLDLRPWPGEGCPVRARFGFAGASEQIVVTRAEYANTDFELVYVIRACTLATGADAIVLQSGGGERIDVIGVSGSNITVRREKYSREGCEWVTIETVSVQGLGLSSEGPYEC